MQGDEDILTVALDDRAAGLRLDRALAEALPSLSRERLKTLIKGGRVADASGAVLWDPSAKAAAPATIAVRLPAPAPAHNVAQDLALVIAYEDEHLIVVDKPAGMVVHPAAGNADGTMVNALLHHCAGQLSGIGGVARPGIVHRIDKDTSGLIVAAKHDKAHEGLAKQFAAHSIDRRYLALATGRPMPANGTVDAALGRSSANRKKMAVVPAGRGKHAITHYRTIEPLAGATLVECRLETGRTHQVRVHMAHIGHPLVGDPVYGRARKPLSDVLKARGFARQALHAAHLGFIHPATGNRIALDSELPQDMRELIDELRV
ncbi:RluA family pseudouridine synthase [Sphingopyxis sp. NJF-3]